MTSSLSREAPAVPSGWIRILARYRDPHTGRSLCELAASLGPFVLLWALAWWALAISPWLAAAIAAANGLFLVRLFAIQHDCGHGSFLGSRPLGDWLGRILGVVTLTPYLVWRRDHSAHHAGSGNLGRRGIGDIDTLTVDEYRARTPLGRWRYRLYRHPFVLFAIGPAYIFLGQNRLPSQPLEADAAAWASAMGTNVAIAAALGTIAWFGGPLPLLAIFLPTTLVAASIGVWLFYVQHQFETTHWDAEAEWQIHDAAFHGSSHYVLPGVLRWLTANIGVHHVHHLYSRIPFYRLPEVLRDNPALADAQRLGLRESLGCVRLHLWDTDRRRLLSFAEARRAYGVA